MPDTAAKSAGGFPSHAVAVVGLAGRFPDAPTLDRFWDNIRDGVESLATYSQQEMVDAGMPPELLKNPNYVPKGTTLDAVEMFDAEFFQYAPGEAQIMDPQQRLFLECAWEVLEHAGYPAGGVGFPVGLYAGVSMNTYMMFHVLANRPLAEAAGGYQLMLGNDKDFLCTRASYKLDLKGPSVTLQTACSTSLVAVEMACRALARGECDMAIAGGSSMNFPQKSGYLYQEGMIFSPDGHCRPFDKGAKGTRAGAGVGLVALKRYSDAVRDGDTVHAVIRGAAINNDGGSKAGYTAPSIDGQTEVIAMAQAVAGVEPRSIGFMEAHGTATPLGDPIEIAALTRAFRDRTGDTGFCRLGALKANIGHLDAAAGVAGLIKAVLCLKNAYIPPLVNFTEPNPQLQLDESPFAASGEGSDWVAGDGPRRAAVSSFGIGGTNAHVILEEAPTLVTAEAPDGPQTLVLSARTETALAAAAANLADALEADGPAMADVAHTLLRGRKPFPHRRVVVAATPEDAAEALRKSARGIVHEGGARKVAFLFSGQGSQYAGMGQGLYDLPEYREAFDACADILLEPLGLDLRKAVFEGTDAELGETWLTQPALFATEYSLAKLWMARGFVPKAMMGHSIGEYVAAHLAGVMSLEDALKLVSLRGKLMQEMAPGSMAAVPLPAGDLRRRLNGRAEIAAENALELNVISGETQALDELIAELEADGINARKLHTSHAFHSRMMDPALDRFAEAVGEVALSEPRIRYVSNVTGTWITAQEAMSPDYYARHLRSAVRFAPGVQLLGNDPNLALLEVGPGTTLATLAGLSLPASRNRIAASLSHPGDRMDDKVSVLEATGRLWAAGVAIGDTGFGEDDARPARRVPLPTYPFERKRHWVDPAADAPVAAATTGTGIEIGRTGDPFLTVPSWSTAAPLTGTGGISGRWLALVDTAEMAKALDAELRAKGAETVVTHLPQDGADPTDPTALVNVLEGQTVAGIVVALGKGRAAFDAMVSLAHLAQAAPMAQLVPVFAVTRGAFSVLGEPVADAEAALLTGPVLALSEEVPVFQMFHLDLAADPNGGAEALARIIAEEAGNGDGERIRAIRHRIRFHRRFEAVTLPAKTTGPLKENGVCLITGGLGALGLALARDLAEAGKARLVLTGRGGLPPREEWDTAIAQGHPKASAIEVVREIEAMGSEVHVATCDVTDAEGIEALAAEIRGLWGGIDGIVHAAGTSGSGNLAVLQTPDEMDATLAPKVVGVHVLARAFQEESPDFVVLMSSINSIVPLAGAIDYAAANAVLDAWPASAERPSTWKSVTVINWEGWADIGMAAEIAASNGIDRSADLIETEAALRVFRRFATGPDKQVIVTAYDLPALALAAKRALDRGEVPGAEATVMAADAPVVAGNDFAPRDRFENDDQHLVAVLLAELLQVELTGPGDDFFELGGHSLMATRFLARLETVGGVKLTLRDVFDGRTVEAIAAKVSDAGGGGADGDGELEEFVL